MSLKQIKKVSFSSEEDIKIDLCKSVRPALLSESSSEEDYSRSRPFALPPADIVLNHIKIVKNL
jgi:hypothetical protein